MQNWTWQTFMRPFSQDNAAGRRKIFDGRLPGSYFTNQLRTTFIETYLLDELEEVAHHRLSILRIIFPSSYHHTNLAHQYHTLHLLLYISASSPCLHYVETHPPFVNSRVTSFDVPFMVAYLNGKRKKTFAKTTGRSWVWRRVFQCPSRHRIDRSYRVWRRNFSCIDYEHTAPLLLATVPLIWTDGAGSGGTLAPTTFPSRTVSYLHWRKICETSWSRRLACYALSLILKTKREMNWSAHYNSAAHGPFWSQTDCRCGTMYCSHAFGLVLVCPWEIPMVIVFQGSACTKVANINLALPLDCIPITSVKSY